MRITQEADNAFRVVLYLSTLPENERQTARKISEEMKISMQFTLKILNKLTRQGITRAYRGVHGGYMLARPAAEITMRDVLETIDGPTAINRCLLDPALCNRNAANHCPVHDALCELQTSVVQKLTSVNMAQLAQSLHQ